MKSDSPTYSVKELRTTYPNAYAPWDDDDDDILRDEYSQFLEGNDDEGEREFFLNLAHKLGRKRSAIRSRLKKIFDDEGIISVPTHKISFEKKSTVLSKKNREEKVDGEIKRPIEINEQFRETLDILENTNTNVFITGKAGTGKSTLLSYFRNTTKKNVVVLAPTGVAALNIKGQTIHSFFGFKPDVTLAKIKQLPKSKEKENLYKNIEMIIIDEISMVRADLLDCIDKFMRLNSGNSTQTFGGVQMVFFGDLYQIPPVVTSNEKMIFQTSYSSPYFFDSNSFPSLKMQYIELEKIYRQQDEKFIRLLNRIRNNSITEEDIQLLNERYNPNFDPSDENFFIYLTPTNQSADEINQQRLHTLPSKTIKYLGEIDGNFEMKTLPAKNELELKPNAQVMMLNNDMRGRWVNGSVGKIVRIAKKKFEDDDGEMFDVLKVKLSDGEVVDVTPFSWELFRFSFDEHSSSLQSETIGTFTQYPLMLAWAVTIHKSQGKTFDNVILDIGRGTFAHGQTYVALSRCTSLEGLVLKKPLQKRHILMDYRVVKFLTNYQYELANKTQSFEEKIALLERAIREKKNVEMLYLKSIDEKSKRTIQPTSVGEEEYMGKRFWALRGIDLQKNEERVFSVGKILELKVC
ncbi:MAG: AAA family ATPase [Ignavibacteriales bacterium]|nr:AAA family ATPase [Ignavibacteriales bacterium]